MLHLRLGKEFDMIMIRSITWRWLRKIPQHLLVHAMPSLECI